MYTDKITYQCRRIYFINKYKTYTLLVASSSTFLYPTVIAFYYNNYVFMNISFFSFLFSTLHWIDTHNYYYRVCDLYFSKFAFLIYFLFFIYNCNCSNIDIFSISTMISLFGISNYCLYHEKKYWVYYHFIFHIFVTLNQVKALLYFQELVY